MLDRLRGLLLRVRALFRRDVVERELDNEVRFHLEMEVQRGIALGLTPAEARRDAQLRFGGVERFKDEARDTRGLNAIDELRTDVRLSLRLLRRNALFTTAAIASLALGIGANTAIFSVVNAVLLRDTPFAEPDELVMLWETDRDSETMHEPAAWPDIVDFKAGSRTLEDVGALVGSAATVTRADADPERISAISVTPNLLTLLGVRPLAGRLFTNEEGAGGGGRVAVMSEEYWRTRFNADPAIIGSTLLVNEQPTTIVGIAPHDADLGLQQLHARADYSAPFSGPEVDLHLAFSPTPASYPRSTHPFLTIARLAPGATIAAARTELTQIAAQLEETYPDNQARGVNLEPYSDVIFGAVRPVLFLLLGAVALVLLVTCANVANLLLARTTVRVREVVLRRALGAASGRIVRQFLVESTVLTLAGAIAGIGIAHVGLRVLVQLAPADIPRMSAVTLDARVLFFTLALSILVSVAFGLLPALQVRRLDLHDVLKAQSTRNTTTNRRGRSVRSALVVAEVALAVALVIGAGLLLRSFWHLNNTDPGFRTAQVLKLQYDLPQSRYPFDFQRWPNLTEIHQLNAEFLSRVSTLPGVESVALSAPHPFDAGFTNSFGIVGREAESENFPEIRTRFITPEYLTTLGVPLLGGRALSSSDVAGAPPAVMLNRAAVDRYYAGADPVGTQINFWGQVWQVVGVIGNERFRGVAHESEPAAYAALAQAPTRGSTTLLVRASGDVLTHVPAIRRELRALDPQLALYGVETLEQTLTGSIARPRFTALLLSLFAAIAIVLALIGVHGVLSYTVAQRSAEVGIRLALGASRASVLRLVIGEGVRLATLGVALGVLAALLGARVLPSLLFGVTATDPATFAFVAVAVLVTAGVASWLPARRAMRVDPATTLRAD